MSTQEVINGILHQYGVDILLNGKLFCSIFGDTAPECKLEQKVFRRMEQENLLKEVHSIFTNSKNDADKLVVLMQDFGFSSEWCKAAINAFGLTSNFVFDQQETPLQKQLSPIQTKSHQDDYAKEINYMYFCIENEDWQKAEHIIDTILMQDVTNYDALVAKILCKNKVTQISQLMLYKIMGTPYYKMLKDKTDHQLFENFYKKLNKQVHFNSSECPWFSIDNCGNLRFDGDVFARKTTDGILILPYRFSDYNYGKSSLNNEIAIDNVLNIDFTGNLLSVKTLIISDGIMFSDSYWISKFVNLEKLFYPEFVHSNFDFSTTELEDLSKLKFISFPKNLELRLVMFKFLLLEEVILPKEISSIPPLLFLDCPQLKKVVLPESLEVIPFKSFSNCTSLKEIYIPDSVKEIQSEAFCGCTALESIHFSSSLSHIESNAFENCTKLKSVALPESVNKIDDLAFHKCYSLDYVETKEPSIEFGNGVFNRCDRLKKVILSASSNYKVFDNFLYNTSEQKMISVFGNYSETFRIPDYVKAIGKNAFWDCNRLKMVVLPSTDIKIEGNPFSGCHNLIEIDTSKSDYFFVKDNMLFDNRTDCIITFLFGTKQKNVFINDSISMIGECAFADSNTIETVTINGQLKEIGMSAFWGCSSLKEIVFPKSLTQIAERAFQNCEKLTSLILPDLIEEIEQFTFCGCKSINKVVFPASLKEIKMYAFSGCENIIEIEFPSNLSLIGDNAFYDCKRLCNIKLSNSPLKINEYAFANCSDIFEIMIPQNVEKIAEDAFDGIKNLSIINFSPYIKNDLDSIIKKFSYYDDRIVNVIDGKKMIREKDIINLRKKIEFLEISKGLQQIRYDKLKFKLFGKGAKEKEQVLNEILQTEQEIDELKTQIDNLLNNQ